MKLNQLSRIANIISAIIVNFMAIIGIINGIMYGDFKWVTLILILIIIWTISFAFMMTTMQQIFRKMNLDDWDPFKNHIS